MKQHAAILIVLVAVAVGCASINDQMGSWVGHHQQELILNWGLPLGLRPTERTAGF